MDRKMNATIMEADLPDIDTADGENIYYNLRVMNGFTMAGLAPLLQCNKNRINSLEHGKNTKAKVVKAYSELFDIPMDALLRNNVAAIAAAKNVALPSVGGNRHKVRMLKRVDNGDIGEELVAKLERARLAGTGYENCVSTRPAHNRRNGYDVISSTAAGKSKYIEVKTTCSEDPDEPFFMTDAEYRRMKEFYAAGAVYELFRVYDLNVETMDYSHIVYTPQEVIDLFEPVPETYRMVKRKGGERG